MKRFFFVKASPVSTALDAVNGCSLYAFDSAKQRAAFIRRSTGSGRLAVPTTRSIVASWAGAGYQIIGHKVRPADLTTWWALHMCHYDPTEKVIC